MRIRISHATTYRYDTPPTSVTQMLRLTPRNHDGQYVVDWRVDLSEDCLLHQHEDAFGNIDAFLHRRGAVQRIVDRGRGRGRHSGYQRRRRRGNRALSAGAVPARDRAHARGPGHRRFCRDDARADAGGDTVGAAARPDDRDSTRDDIRHQTRPRQRRRRQRPSRCVAASARTSRTSSSRRRANSAFRRVTSAAISIASTA